MAKLRKSVRRSRKPKMVLECKVKSKSRSRKMKSMRRRKSKSRRRRRRSRSKKRKSRSRRCKSKRDGCGDWDKKKDGCGDGCGDWDKKDGDAQYDLNYYDIRPRRTVMGVKPIIRRDGAGRTSRSASRSASRKADGAPRRRP
jgi:hypothetical protein